MNRTCWREMQIDHPAEWELSFASGMDEPGRCVFSDRIYQRLEVRWRALKYVPKIELMLDKHRLRQDENLKIEKLDGPGPDWQGVVRSADDVIVTHAARFFRDSRLLVEATTVWPQRQRDAELERAVLNSIQPVDVTGSVRPWQAMGMSMCIGCDFKLRSRSSKVGRLTWRFDRQPKDHLNLTVERLAMPEYWLKGELGDWLESELPPEFRQARRSEVHFAGHDAQQLISCARASTLAALRGRKRLRLDLAWLCQTERRAYHVSLLDLSRDKEPSLPQGFDVWCCKPIGAATCPAAR